MTIVLRGDDETVDDDGHIHDDDDDNHGSSQGGSLLGPPSLAEIWSVGTELNALFPNIAGVSLNCRLIVSRNRMVCSGSRLNSSRNRLNSSRSCLNSSRNRLNSSQFFSILLETVSILLNSSRNRLIFSRFIVSRNRLVFSRSRVMCIETVLLGIRCVLLPLGYASHFPPLPLEKASLFPPLISQSCSNTLFYCSIQGWATRWPTQSFSIGIVKKWACLLVFVGYKSKPRVDLRPTQNKEGGPDKESPCTGF